ncbi:glucose-1-phosphate cytidylyltransferase [Leptospira sp. 'Mane']|uniref:glucose-1-phosphate cytidylyltransferase n=1 Tax=Leptospira sp. 'Mane' TaxID=3387407 RepID=UPI00398AD5CC
MKVVILAGGYGTRISEESHLKPKPMIEIGERPILWHIMKIYSHYGFNDFVVCLGYKAYAIKEYFANYFLHESDVTFDFRDSNRMTTHIHKAEPWKVTLVNTGLDTMTGGRVKRIRDYIDNETFMLTYGDGVSNVDLPKLLAFHKNHGKAATLTAIQPSGRFGALEITENNSVTGFKEKPKGESGWVNGGFMVLEPSIFDLIEGDKTVLEKEPLESLSNSGNLFSYKHDDFWQPMDTIRDKMHLEGLWQSGKAPWKVWT